MRKCLLNPPYGEEYSPYIEPKLLELIKNYSDDDVWKMMRSITAAYYLMRSNFVDLPDSSWIEEFAD